MLQVSIGWRGNRVQTFLGTESGCRNRVGFVKAASPRGFSLIEILVVVAILALLVAILLPSLQRARKQARDLMCATNLRTTGSAVYFYTQANRDYYPSAGTWAEQCAIYAQKFSLARKGSNKKDLYQFIEFYLCPSDPVPHPSHNFKRIIGGQELNLNYDMSYGLSAFLVNPPQNPSAVQAGTSYALDGDRQQKSTAIRRPAQIVMLTDAGNDGLHAPTELEWDFDVDPDYSGGLLEVHHQNGNQFLFADQHVEYRKILDRTPRQPGSMAALIEHIRRSGVPPFPSNWIALRGR